MDTVTLIKERYGEKAIPHKRETPFAENDLMVTDLDGEIKCRQYSPAVPDGLFVVEYYENTGMYRLDVDFNAKVVNVIQMKYTPPSPEHRLGTVTYPKVATYSFDKDHNAFCVSYVSGENLFFNNVRDALKTYFDVKEGFIWITK